MQIDESLFGGMGAAPPIFSSPMARDRLVLPTEAVSASGFVLPFYLPFLPGRRPGRALLLRLSSAKLDTTYKSFVNAFDCLFTDITYLLACSFTERGCL